MNILIVDDDDDLLHFVAILVKVHYPPIIVTMAHNGKEALAIAAKSMPPAVVITDITMPMLDGNKLCHILKDIYGDIVKVVALTANASMIDADFDAVVSKPFTEDVLFAAIDEMLRIRELGTQLS